MSAHNKTDASARSEEDDNDPSTSSHRSSKPAYRLGLAGTMKYSLLGVVALLASGAFPHQPQVPFAAQDSTSEPNGLHPGVIQDPTLVANRTYDYVIAGGGLSGLTIASQLLESPGTDFTVLVIENGCYGSEYGAVIDDLNTYGQIFGSSVDHGYETVPQKNNRVEIVRSGNGLGGSTLINGGTWTRPHKVQIDSWSKVFGNTEWTWEKLAPYMDGIENPRDPTDTTHGLTPGSWHYYNPQCHNQADGTGRVQVGARDLKRKWSQVIPALMHTVNTTYPDAPTQRDLCCGDPRGVSMFMNTLTPNQVRTDAGRAWLAPVLRNETTKDRITVLTGQMVGKVLLKENKDPRVNGKYKATGVEYGIHSKNGWKWNVTAKQEVLVAAGSAISPLILQWSGVGPKEALEKANVQQKLDLPVGLNLQDQTTTNVRSEMTPKGNGQGQAAYFATFSEIFGPDAAEYEGILNDDDNLKKWAGETVAGGGFHNSTALLQQYRNYQRWLLEDNVTYTELFLDTDNRINFDLWGLLPFTRGYTRILDRDPYLRSFEYNPRYFENELDVAGQAAASRLARNLTRTHDMAQYAGKELIPGHQLQMDATLSQWINYVKQTFRANFHGVGTCSMMARDQGGVVDQKARVYDVDGLRVVDGSIPPTQVSSHVMTVFYGMAVKIADAILQDYKNAQP